MTGVRNEFSAVESEVLDKHYDKRDEEVKVEQRRDYINGI